MKREDLIDSLEYIDDEFIQEADRTRSAEENAGDPGKITPIRRRKASVRRWGTLAASFAVFVIAAFVLSGVMQARNGAKEVMQSAEAVRDENAREELYETEEAAGAAGEGYASNEAAEAAAEEYAVSGQTGTSAPEETAVAEEQADAAAEAYAASGQAKASAPEEAAVIEEQADAFAPEEPAAMEETAAETEEPLAAAMGSVRIRVLSEAGEILFELNDSPAAESLAAQLPLTADTEPYSNNEIVFHPEKPLDVENGVEGGGTAGYIGYYEPWNNVVLYYGDFEEYPGLYILGKAVSGAENIQNIRGSITIESE